MNTYLNFNTVEDYKDAIEGLQEELTKAKLEAAGLRKQLAVLEEENAALRLNILLRN